MVKAGLRLRGYTSHWIAANNLMQIAFLNLETLSYTSLCCSLFLYHHTFITQFNDF